MAPFASSIWAKAEALRTLRDLPRPLEQRLKESISDDLKKATNFQRHYCSHAAERVAAALSRPVDLREQTWHDQGTFDPNRRLFVVEHKVTIASLRDLCRGAPDVANVLDILVDKFVVVWVLREEDDRLTRLGYRTKRPDPDAAYREAEIHLLDGSGPHICPAYCKSAEARMA
jgi:hypothetical protein